MNKLHASLFSLRLPIVLKNKFVHLRREEFVIMIRELVNHIVSANLVVTVQVDEYYGYFHFIPRYCVEYLKQIENEKIYQYLVDKNKIMMRLFSEIVCHNAITKNNKLYNKRLTHFLSL